METLAIGQGACYLVLQMGKRKDPHFRYWTEDEIDWLKKNYLEYRDTEIAARFNRTVVSVWTARKRFRLSRMVPIGYNLQGLSDSTGYDPDQIKRAREALGQKWERKRAGRYAKDESATRFVINETQANDIIEFLGSEWGPSKMKLKACTKCGETERPHKGYGLCTRCYATERFRAKHGRPSILAHVFKAEAA